MPAGTLRRGLLRFSRPSPCARAGSTNLTPFLEMRISPWPSDAQRPKASRIKLSSIDTLLYRLGWPSTTQRLFISLNHAFAQAQHDDSEELQGAGLQSEHQQVRYGILQADIVLTSTAQSGLFILDMPNWSNAYQNARRHVRECITLLTPAARYGGGL